MPPNPSPRILPFRVVTFESFGNSSIFLIYPISVQDHSGHPRSELPTVCARGLLRCVLSSPWACLFSPGSLEMHTVSKVCPSSITKADLLPTIATQLETRQVDTSCPNNDYTTPDGLQFDVHCNRNLNAGKDSSMESSASSVSDCMNQCSRWRPECYGVAFNTTDGELRRVPRSSGCLLRRISQDPVGSRMKLTQ